MVQEGLETAAQHDNVGICLSGPHGPAANLAVYQQEWFAGNKGRKLADILEHGNSGK